MVKQNRREEKRVLIEDNGRIEQKRREFLQKIMVEQNRIEEKRVLIEDNGRVEQNRREESSYRR